MATSRQPPPLSPLALRIYPVLRAHLRVHPSSPSSRTFASTITYGTLAPLVQSGARVMDGALGELVDRCTWHGLPPLSALVVGRTHGIPGDGYFTAAHPQIPIAHPKKGPRTEAALAWAYDVTQVCAAARRYPHPRSF